MTIRLTDLDQDDTTPIEMMRDPIGVLLTDDEGWSAVSLKAGFAESGTGAPAGLPGAMSWITNKPYDLVSGVRMTIGRPDVRLRANDWIKPDLDEMIEDWAGHRLSRPKRAELLAKMADRIMRLSYEAVRAYADLSLSKEQALLDMMEKTGSLASGFRIVLSADMEKDLTGERRLSGATYSAMKFGAFVREDSACEEDEIVVRLRPPRFPYAEAVLSRPVPSAGKWQQARLENADVLSDEHIRGLRELDRPVLISARSQAIPGKEDPQLSSWTVPTGQGFVRKTYTLEEVSEMAGSYRFHTPLVMVGPGWRKPSAADLLKAVRSSCGLDELAYASWSAGVVAENVLRGAMGNARPPKGKTLAITNPQSVWIGAHDRILMRPLVDALRPFGVTWMGGYAGGLRFKTSRDPEMLSALVNAAWEMGLHAQMGLLKRVRALGGEILCERELYGGDAAHALGPLLTQSVLVGPLWRIDEMIELDPERRADAFLGFMKK